MPSDIRELRDTTRHCPFCGASLLEGEINLPVAQAAEGPDAHGGDPPSRPASGPAATDAHALPKGGDDYAPRNADDLRKSLAPGGTGKGGYETEAAHEAVTPSGARRIPKPQAPGGGACRNNLYAHTVHAGEHNEPCACGCGAVIPAGGRAWQSYARLPLLYWSLACVMRVEWGL